jgi:MFS family permease
VPSTGAPTHRFRPSHHVTNARWMTTACDRAPRPIATTTNITVITATTAAPDASCEVACTDRPRGTRRGRCACVGHDGAVIARRGWHRLAGDEPLASYALAHVIAGAGDAFVTVSLAGSLFFNVSADASRNQIVLYLAVTMAPFALLAPLVAPAIDRYRGAHRSLASLTFLVRAVAAVGLAFTLYELTFYVLALVLLVGSKASGVVRQALVPRLVDDPGRLVAANSRLALLGTVVGSLAGAAAVALTVAGAPSLLGIAAALFVAAALAVWRLPRTLPSSESVPELEYAELHAPRIVGAAAGLMALRGGVGFFVFMLAFTLRRESEPAWVYGLAVVGYGVGSFVGNLVAPILRRRFNEDMLMAGALGAAATMCAVATLGLNRASLAAVAAVLGLGASLGRQAFDSMLQIGAPDALRGQAFARYETRFQLSWVLGALVATAAELPVWLSMLVLAVLFVTAAVLYLRGARMDLRFGRPPGEAPLDAAASRAAVAAALLRHGHVRYALSEALSSIDLARVAGVVPPPVMPLARLESLRRRTVEPSETITEGDVTEALGFARAMLEVSSDRWIEPSTDRPTA